jgi:hypothetical protein
MKRKSLILFFVVPLVIIMAGVSIAGVNVGVSIGLPPVYTFAEPPELVVIPNTYVYYPPGADLDIVFYGGYWYRPYNGYWYRSSGYNGPWRHIGIQRVPRYIVDLPPNYRTMYRDYPRIPHRHVHDNWRQWQKEKYWNKREWKHDQNEWKREQHDDRREHHEDRRDHR